MRLQNPNQFAAFISALTALFAALLLLAIDWVFKVDMPLWSVLLFAIIVFLMSFGLTWWAVERFLQSKIQMLYRSIQRPGDSSGTEKMGANSADILGEVQRDVEEWASVKQEEIQALKEQAQFRRDFIGNLAHELKTPIFNMQGYLLTLLEGGLEDPKINVDYLTRADKNLERLISLVEDLDSISKLEAGRELLKIEKLNLLDVIEEVMGLVEDRAEEKSIDLRLNKKYDRPIWVKADREKVIQVFSNLVLNAIYYGRYEGFCEIRILDMPQTVMIEIADDGIGVEATHLPRLFERFYRVDKSRSRNQGGTGLGLAIVKHIIESHGQTISVRSVLDQGTTFSFTLDKAK
jgi:two-component system, OmpR family, phosphate regulon sensor histidine kinase PhoR